MTVRSSAFVVCIAASLFSCSDDERRADSVPIPEDTTDDTTSDAGTTPSESEIKRAAAAEMFAEDQIHTFDLVISEENLASIDSNPTAEQWVEGTLVMDGVETAERVGIRYKGSEGAWYGCVQGGPWGGGPKICPLNMKVKIDYQDDTTFHGLKTLQLHAMNDHPSRLTETIAYWFVREMGIAAPRTAFCKVLINGSFEGFFLHVEDMDSRFVDNQLPDSDANLFKEVWPLTWEGTANSETAMVEALRTNEKEPDVTRLRTFALELEAAQDTTAVRGVVEKWMDVDEAVTLAALTLALDDDDGVFHWYALDETSVSAARPHNFYWMEDPEQSKFHLLPWDLDKAFTLVANPDTSNAIEILDPWGTTSHDCQNYGSGWRQRSAACDKLVAALASYKELYRAKLQAILDGPFASVDALLATWTSRLEPTITALPSDNGQGITLEGWKSGVADLQQEIADARAGVAAAVSAP